LLSFMPLLTERDICPFVPPVVDSGGVNQHVDPDPVLPV
jgi:hypothetical protein